MKVKLRERRVKVMTFLVVMLVICISMAPVSLNAGICEKGFSSCISDAMTAGLATWNLAVLSAFATGCALGYDWCLKYFKK